METHPYWFGFYEKIMTYTIRYGVLRAKYPESANELEVLEDEMRAFIKDGLASMETTNPQN